MAVAKPIVVPVPRHRHCHHHHVLVEGYLEQQLVENSNPTSGIVREELVDPGGKNMLLYMGGTSEIKRMTTILNPKCE